MVTEMMESIKELQGQLQENSDRISEGKGLGLRVLNFSVVTMRMQFTVLSSRPFRLACAPCLPFSAAFHLVAFVALQSHPMPW